MAEVSPSPAAAFAETSINTVFWRIDIVEIQKSKPHSFPLIIRNRRKGSSLVLVVISVVVLSFLGIGMLKVAYGVRHRAIQTKNEAVAMLAAEAGYEKAIFWMSQNKDMLSAIQQEDPGTSGGLNLPSGDANYQVMLYTFAGYRPVYRVLSTGHCGEFTRAVDVLVLQALSGWDMGKCEVPTGSSSTIEVYFADGEVIDMPLHINDQEDSPDDIDIHVSGDPQFMQTVGMGESRYNDHDSDKYGSVLEMFDNGILFDQPDNRVTDTGTVQNKIDRFKDSTKVQCRFSPVANASVTNPNAAVQLEFFVEDEVGKVRITNDCTVRGNTAGTYDYKIKPGTDGKKYEKYDIYGYHYIPENAETTGQRTVLSLEETYVTQDFGGVESEPGGQIYVDGNVVIGGDLSSYGGSQVVKGRISVVASGNIWIADSITVDGSHDVDGKPSADNTNILGLVAEGVIKVIDPGLSSSSGEPSGYSGLEYEPIGLQDESSGGEWVWKLISGHWQKVYQETEPKEYDRVLPDQVVVEAALTVGGGGWGAENVGDRKEYSGKQDDLILRGTITEAIRGAVGLVGNDGFLKYYYFDSRVLEGILPGDIWLQGKFIPAPAGWHDYRPVSYD